MTGPCLCTVYADWTGDPVSSRLASRTAVATIEEATVLRAEMVVATSARARSQVGPAPTRDSSADDVAAYFARVDDVVRALTGAHSLKSTLAPARRALCGLRDGTVIEVRKVGEGRMRADLRRLGWQGFDFAGWARRDLASEWVAAFNAAPQGGAR